MATKTKHKEVTLKTKYEALKELDKNGLKKEVATQFNVPGSTLATWRKKKEKNLPSFFFYQAKFITETTKSQCSNRQ